VRLTRVHSTGPLAAGTEITLPESAAKHVTRVLRLRADDPLVIFDGRGGDFRAEIASITGGTVRVRLLGHVAGRPESPLAITLIQGLSRGERMDWTLQKATELGVSVIAPVLTARSVVRLDARQAEAKLRHWQAIVVAACEQSGRSIVPELRAPEPLRACLARPARSALRVVLDPNAGAELTEIPAPADAVDLLIGPEGGFEADELEAARAAGYRSARLGPRVLRTETAGIVALAVLQSRFGDLAGREGLAQGQETPQL
jgi:16S rRNA (uracil1498-N3)-methyltransferase